MGPREYSPAARRKIAAKVTDALKNGDVFAYFKHEDTPECVLNAEQLLKTAQ